MPHTLVNFDGSIITRGKAENVLSGDHQYSSVGVPGFPDLENAHAWYHSKANQALIPLRDGSAKMSVVSYQVPNA